MTDTREPRPGGEVVVYEAPDGEVALDVRLEQETVWLTLHQMAELFERDLSVVSRHIRNAYREGELEREATFAKFATVRREGGRRVVRQIDHFNLDVIISVGYRVKSLRGTQFRQWATRRLREHLVSGYTLNRQRLAERGLREARDTASVPALPSPGGAAPRPEPPGAHRAHPPHRRERSRQQGPVGPSDRELAGGAGGMSS